MDEQRLRDQATGGNVRILLGSRAAQTQLPKDICQMIWEI